MMVGSCSWKKCIAVATSLFRIRESLVQLPSISHTKGSVLCFSGSSAVQPDQVGIEQLHRTAGFLSFPERSMVFHQGN